MNFTASATLLHSPPTLASRLFALLAPARLEEGAAAEAHWLAAQGEARPLLDTLNDWTRKPPPEDARLHALAGALGLEFAELLALTLALAADTDLIAGRVLAWLQAPIRDAYPTVGLVASLEEHRGRSVSSTVASLLDGTAVASGLLLLEAQDRGLPDARLRVPPPLVAALGGGQGGWQGVSFDSGDLPPLAESLRAEAGRRAAGLDDGALMVRSGHPVEARAACAAIAEARGQRAVFVDGEPPAGLGPWLTLHDALPVLCDELSPGERRRLPPLPGHSGVILLACGPEGSWERDGEALPAWRVAVPPASERSALWRAQGLEEESATMLGEVHRHASARIAQLARVAGAGEAGSPTSAQVARAAREAGQGALGTLAELLPEDIPDDALILPEALQRELQVLVARCRARDTLSAGLGPAARARYHPGVRALFTGISGTGKTLACGWLATHLGMPLYRVDMAAVASKYIGETEKNLGELFARAEHAEVVLLFDEADALFGARTEVKDANDRFANQQTNYLLQRIESFDGIVLLTSNSRARFDSAFTRRLDAILEFPAPGPSERRALWLAHLGDAHAFSAADLNRLSVACDLPGGHIRNLVLSARALAPGKPIAWPALERALVAEYRKLGKSLPAPLKGGG